jgi:hypothetical protein
MKKNSINRNLKQHGFEIDEEWKVGQGFGNRFPMIVSSSRQWVKRVFKFGSFNGQSSDSEVAIATEYGRQVRNGQMKCELSRPSSNFPTLSSSFRSSPSSSLSVPIREETTMKANTDVTVDIAVAVEAEAEVEIESESEMKNVLNTNNLMDKFSFEADALTFGVGWSDDWVGFQDSMFRF